MDQKKQGQESGQPSDTQPEGFKGQQQPPQHQGGSTPQGSQPSGQQKRQEPETQNPDREPAEGPRDMPGQEPRHMPGSQEKGRDQSGGITNRDLDREMEEQEELPERGGTRQSER